MVVSKYEIEVKKGEEVSKSTVDAEGIVQAMQVLRAKDGRVFRRADKVTVKRLK